MKTSIYAVMHNDVYSKFKDDVDNIINDLDSDISDDAKIKYKCFSAYVDYNLIVDDNTTCVYFEYKNIEDDEFDKIDLLIKKFLSTVDSKKYLYIQHSGNNDIIKFGNFCDNPFGLRIRHDVYTNNNIITNKNIFNLLKQVNRNIDTLRMSVSKVIKNQEIATSLITRKHRNFVYPFCIAVLSISIYELIRFLFDIVSK